MTMRIGRVGYDWLNAWPATTSANPENTIASKRFMISPPIIWNALSAAQYLV
jgi:hypothetical protein